MLQIQTEFKPKLVEINGANIVYRVHLTNVVIKEILPNFYYIVAYSKNSTNKRRSLFLATYSRRDLIFEYERIVLIFRLITSKGV